MIREKFVDEFWVEMQIYRVQQCLCSNVLKVQRM